MIRVVLTFIVLTILFHFGIQAWRSATGKERWAVVKCLTYSLFLAIITFAFLITLVVLF